jgi:hypothetical protein
MNPPYDIAPDIHIPPPAATCTANFEKCVRKNPGSTLLLAAGLGLAALLVARALTPPPPRSRAMCLLEDIQQHLAALAKEGRHAVNQGADSLGELHLDRSFGKLGSKIKSLFH